MKTTKFKLFATMITLAAVTIASSIPANAQRRSTQRESSNSESRRSTDRKNTLQQKSTFKNYDKVDRSSVNRGVTTRRNQSSKVTVNSSRSAPRNSRQSVNSGSKNNSDRINRDFRNNNNLAIQRNSTATRQSASRVEVRKSNANSSSRTETAFRGEPNRNTRVAPSSVNERRNTGRNVNVNRDFYNVDRSDRRYSPNREYRGNNKTWSNRYRPGGMNYNHSNKKYYAHYNYNKRKHWDRRWENYRWNYNSWRDYYYGYNPYSYRYHRYYYHHPNYGHVIRRFDVMPVAFYHDRHRYFCYNGHFFSFRPGIGYILVDLPYGFSFDYLPAGYYERVYINGYLYFRVGNLFFESTPYGFQLIHYPERYYAYNDSYYSPGLRFGIDIDIY